MARSRTFAQALELLGRALAAGAVVELAGRALVEVTAAGPVRPRDRTGAWPGFLAPEPGVYACCPLWHGVPAALLSPACRGWLRLGEVGEVGELLPVAEWLAALGEPEARALVVGFLHGLGRLAEGAPVEDGSRLLVRTPENLVRDLFG